VRVYLAPGWRGTGAVIAPWVAGLRRRGFDAHPVLPGVGRAEQRREAFLTVASPEAAIGGLSFGGRVASLVAAEREVGALVCISYPLAGEPEARTRHWPRIRCPALLVNGDEDELAEPDELVRWLPLLRRGRLELIAGGGHSLAPHLERVLDLAADFLASA
jgi:predicted alpha/beta-hydrolase family hydrolase